MMASVKSLSPRKRVVMMESPSPTCTSVTTVSHMMTSADHSSKLITGLDALRTSGVLCDYTIIAGGLEMHVHRAVLVACSDYFRAMLTGDMLESRESSVILQGISSYGLQAVIEFIYSGRLKVSLDDVEEILAAASHLQVGEAVRLCASLLISSVTLENCIDILNISELYSLNTCSELARSFVLANFQSLADQHTDEFMKLSAPQLTSLLSDNALCVASEYRLFDLIIRWVRHDLQAREQHISQLMLHIRLPLCTGAELVERISREPLVKAHNDCYRLLVEAKDYHIVVNKQPLLQTARTQVRSVHQKMVLCHDYYLGCYDLMTGTETSLRDPPVGLYSPCVVAVDNFLYVCGGKYDSTDNNEIATARCHRYDPRFDVWFELMSMNEARKDFALVAFEGQLYAIAGQDESAVSETAERFSIKDDEWTSVSSIPCGPLHCHQAAVCGKRIYVSGGQKFDGYSRGVFSYDPVGDVWRDAPSLIYPRSNHNMAAVGDRLYVVGGNIEDSYGFPVPVSAVEMIEPLTMSSWTTCTAQINIREAGVAVLDSKIYIVGGINGQHYYADSVQVYVSDDDRFEFFDKVRPGMHGRACCVLIVPGYI